jgi:hypothetical protein
MEKEETTLKELLKQQQEILDQKELEICQKEAQETNSVLTLIKNKFARAGESILSAFKMADINRDGTLSFDEFASVCSKQKIYVSTDQLKKVYKLIDSDASDTVSYKELTDVLLGKRTLDLIKIIKEQRIKDGRASGISAEDLKKTAKASVEPSLDTKQKEDVTVSGLSEIMRRSDADKKETKHFVDENQTLQTE